VRYLILGGVAGPVLFALVAIACGALRPGYSQVTLMISELGETGGSYASLMNVLGFIPSGLLIAAFGASLAYLVPRSPLSLVAATPVAIFGLGIAAAGVYSCDPGCPQRYLSSEATLHGLVSITAFIAGVLGTALWAYCFRGLPMWRWLWPFSAASSGTALALLLVLNATADSRSPHGVWKRLFLATLFLWCAVVSIRLFRLTAAGRHAA
jgi:hypothetical membrane protein